MSLNREILDKISSGIGLTDAELDDAINFYGDLIKKVFLLGSEYILFYQDLERTYNQLRQFKIIRAVNKI